MPLRSGILSRHAIVDAGGDVKMRGPGRRVDTGALRLGCLPSTAGGILLFAAGVGGAPGGHLDEQCAVAGLEQVKDLLT